MDEQQESTQLPAWVVNILGKRELEHGLEVQRLQTQIDALTRALFEQKAPKDGS